MPSAISPVPKPARPDTNPPASAPRSRNTRVNVFMVAADSSRRSGARVSASPEDRDKLSKLDLPGLVLADHPGMTMLEVAFTSSCGQVVSQSNSFHRSPNGNLMATFLVCHGAWSAGWAWKKMHPRMQAAGHRLVTPTYTGLGEREHLANPSVDLETHIQDILNVIKYEDLRDIVLIGHSYGGMVATGVADRAREAVAQLIYLDAFVPGHGQCLLDLLPES